MESTLGKLEIGARQKIPLRLVVAGKHIGENPFSEAAASFALSVKA